MKIISSSYTFFFKKIFPVFWFGLVGFMLLGLSWANEENSPPIIIFIIMPIFMAVFGYLFMKKLVFDLIDEVHDEGSSLLFKNGGKEVRVNLNEIKNISYSMHSSPPRVTISIRHETILGKELSFLPPASLKLIPLKKNEEIEKLIDRVDKAKS